MVCLILTHCTLHNCYLLDLRVFENFCMYTAPHFKLSTMHPSQIYRIWTGDPWFPIDGFYHLSFTSAWENMPAPWCPQGTESPDETFIQFYSIQKTPSAGEKGRQGKKANVVIIIGALVCGVGQEHFPIFLYFVLIVQGRGFWAQYDMLQRCFQLWANLIKTYTKIYSWAQNALPCSISVNYAKYWKCLCFFLLFFRHLGLLLHYFSRAGAVSGTLHPATHISSSQFAQSVELLVDSGLQDPQQL